jgi:hypothetical protein
MSEKNKENEHDTEAELQEELRREASEVSDTVGDIAQNRNVSGSSTWTTEPDETKDRDRG